MYCLECKKFFDEPDLMYDDPSPSGISLSEGAYTYETCPHCGGDRIEESGKCPICGDDVEPDETFCKDCRDTIQAELEDVRKRMRASESDFEDLVAVNFGW